MSSTGPAPLRKKKPGFGCQCSMPWDMIAATADNGRPILPPSMARRAVWYPAPRIVSRRRADAETTPLGGGKGSFAVRDCRRQRLLAVDVLAGFKRGERYFGVRLGNGQVEDDVDIVALQKIGDADGNDAMTVGLTLGGLGVDVGAGDDVNVAKELRVDEVDFGDVAAADDPTPRLMTTSLATTSSWSRCSRARTGRSRLDCRARRS